MPDGVDITVLLIAVNRVLRCVGREWPALLRYAVVAAQGSAVAQANLAWLLWRSDAYDGAQKAQMCLLLLSQAAAEMPDGWVEAGDIEYGCHRPGDHRLLAECI